MSVQDALDDRAPEVTLTAEDQDALVYARDLALSALRAAPGHGSGDTADDIRAINAAVDKALHYSSR